MSSLRELAGDAETCRFGGYEFRAEGVGLGYVHTLSCGARISLRDCWIRGEWCVDAGVFDADGNRLHRDIWFYQWRERSLDKRAALLIRATMRYASVGSDLLSVASNELDRPCEPDVYPKMPMTWAVRFGADPLWLQRAWEECRHVPTMLDAWSGLGMSPRPRDIHVTSSRPGSLSELCECRVMLPGSKRFVRVSPRALRAALPPMPTAEEILANRARYEAGKSTPCP